mmetsp:Transcript_7410/g.15811  ORF Transcript_7410/g.15811 Transcript_7410/m.15811 type:complete len:179 (+) Transcript_7410:192-728(+)
MGCIQSRDQQVSGSVLVLGLDGAGSTTIMYQIVLGKKVDTIPTLGFNNEACTYNNMELQLFDIGGVIKVRPVWRQYAPKADGIIFVIDGNDRARFEQAREELAKFYADIPSQKRIPLLIYLNKSDLPNCADVETMEREVGVTSLPVSEFKTVRCCGKTGENLNAGLDWITEKLNRSLQ